jgi:ABC-type uncharacterized transport system substrate-binding protein
LSTGSPTDPTQANYKAAVQLGLDFIELQARTVEEIGIAISSAASTGLNGLVASADSLFGPATGQIGDEPAIRDPLTFHLPTVYSQVGGYIDEGGPLAYSPDFAASQRCAAAYVDKILKGARVADLPVEQAMTFEFDQSQDSAGLGNRQPAVRPAAGDARGPMTAAARASRRVVLYGIGATPRAPLTG